jgi:prolyl-tRNA editing enzyme YbaK/EbsC (Cys-tRNA(Pro) deacylase)
MASEMEVLAATGFERGAVTILGLPRPIRVLADDSVFINSEISIGSGVRGVATILKSMDLHIALDKILTGKLEV